VLFLAAETNLFSPLALGGLSLPNRIAMPPMANNKATLTGDVTDEIIEHYLRHAAGLGLIIVEHAYVTPAGRLNLNQLGIHEEGNVPGLARLAAAIRGTGVPSAIQITHAGGRTTLQAAGTQPEGPSDGIQVRAKEAARGLTTDDLAELRAAFAEAARRAKRAGFGAVELHGAHGYLLNQFYSPLTNLRGDQYGGSRANRLRFPLEVVAATRKALGPGYPLLYRLGGDDLLPGGLNAGDAAYAAPALVEAGVDMIDLSGGLGGSGPATDGGAPPQEGYFGYLGQAVKAVVNVPVMVTGGVRTPQVADRMVRDAVADVVGVGRALLADPTWARRAAEELGAV